MEYGVDEGAQPKSEHHGADPEDSALTQPIHQATLGHSSEGIGDHVGS